jgi:hypothetical protein
MKGAILPGHIGINHYELKVSGLDILTFTEISGLENETTWVELPDRTQASGGETLVGEFTAMMPSHHKAEMAIMAAWHQESKDPVSPTYKKTGTMLYKDIHGNVTMARELIGLAVSKRVDPDLEMENDGEMATTEWTFKYDDVNPLPV